MAKRQTANSAQSQNTQGTEKHWLWKPGVSGNPGGRPKTKRISEAYKRYLEEFGAEKLAEIVVKDAISAAKPGDRLAAIKELTDRVEGKPVQAINAQFGVDQETAEIVAELLKISATKE